MFQSPCGVAWLFANGQCPQPPGTSLVPFPKADAGIVCTVPWAMISCPSWGSCYRSFEDAESNHRGDSSMATTAEPILVTAPSLEVANQLAHGLVTERLAACVNVLPQVMSTYVWEGQLSKPKKS